MTKLMHKQKKPKIEGNFSDLLQQEKWAQGAPNNTIVTAEVKSIDYEKKKVIVDTGFKSNSAIGFQEFKINGEDKIPAVGEFVNVMVKGIDPNNGYVISSFKEVRTKQRMEELENLYHQKQSIEGTIVYKIKSSYIKNNSYAVELGYGITGILTLDGYTEAYPGDKVTVEILKFEQRKFGIVLVKKGNLETVSNGEKPSYTSNDNFKEGEKYTIRVTEIKDFGIIGEKAGTTGKSYNNFFVHGSELFWNRRSRSAGEIEKFYPIGSECNVIAIPFKNRIGFSARYLFEELWKEFQNHIKKNNITTVTGTIIEKRNDGFIVDIHFSYEGQIKTSHGIEGKLSTNNLSWNLEEAYKEYSKMHVGQEVKCAIQDFESIKNQIEEGYGFVPLSKKHLTKDPFESALEHVKLGSTYACQFLEYNDNYHGFLLSLNINGEMTGDDLIVVVRPKDTGSLGQVKAGLKTEAKITRIDDQSRIIFASVKAAETDNKDTLLKEYESNNKQSTATLGSIISNKK